MPRPAFASREEHPLKRTSRPRTPNAELGDLDPTDDGQLRILVGQATKMLRGGLPGLSAEDRKDALLEAQAAAIEAALTYGPSVRTTKWKHAANAANHAARRFLASRAIEVPVSNVGDDADAAGPLEERILLGDQPWDRDEDDPGPAYRPTKDDLAAAQRSHDAHLFDLALATLRGQTAVEPDKTILERWDDPLVGVASALGLSMEGLKQRRKRLRVTIEAVRDDRIGALPADPVEADVAAYNAADPGSVAGLPRRFDP